MQVRASGERVPYAGLSTGIRNFLFRLGHLFLLYFNRQVERGFLLVDEPENSLFPDFLFTLMESYEEILAPGGVNRTQAFFATHSPIVAAQFEPHERILLDWQDGAVVVRRGVAPKGDDPNDLLRRDFQLPHLMGPEGQKKWQEYQDLRKKLRSAPEADRPALMAEALAIGNAYGFDPGRP